MLQSHDGCERTQTNGGDKVALNPAEDYSAEPADLSVRHGTLAEGRGTRTAQTQYEEDLGSRRRSSQKAATENLHADKRRSRHFTAVWGYF